MLNTTFHTLVTEHGIGTQCKAQLLLRTNLEELEPQLFLGIGFSPDGLLARFAAEGELVERATWMYGVLWNSASFSMHSIYLPDDVSLLFSKEHQKELQSVPSITFSAISSCGEELNIPAEAIFHYPKKRQFLKHHSVTTGWAFHSSKKEALAQGYREVIERDLQMLFWFGRLSSFLYRLPSTLLELWGEEYGISKKQLQSKTSELYLIQLGVKLHPSIGRNGYFTLAIVVSDKAPYLTVGSALKTSPKASFSTAMGEMIMLRSYQYDLVLRAKKDDNEESYGVHVSQATYQTTMRDKTKKLLSTIETSLPSKCLAFTDKRLDYGTQNYQVSYFKPPPQTLKGVVAKVWVDNTQGMVPLGFEYTLCSRWKDEWNVTQQEWDANRWHPYP